MLSHCSGSFPRLGIFAVLQHFIIALQYRQSSTQVVSKCGIEFFSFFDLPPHFREIACKGFTHYFKGRAKPPQFIVAVIAPNALINPFFIKDLDRILESSSTMSNSFLASPTRLPSKNKQRSK